MKEIIDIVVLHLLFVYALTSLMTQIEAYWARVFHRVFTVCLMLYAGFKIIVYWDLFPFIESL